MPFPAVPAASIPQALDVDVAAVVRRVVDTSGTLAAADERIERLESLAIPRHLLDREAAFIRSG